MTKQLLAIMLLLSNVILGATFTTTGTPGTWSPAGPPGSSDDIVVNHDWSSYDAAQIANYTGTLTINSGGYYKMAGSFTNFTGTVDIKSGGTFEVTGAVDVAAASSTNIDGNWTVGGDLTNNQTADWTGSGTLSVGGTFTDNGNVNTVTLPVELVLFFAENVNGTAHISWQTASEINNDYFILQRSVDGVIFQDIATIEGNGNSFTPINYFFVDDNLPNTSNVYYRLLQVDLDGSSEYSPVISLNKKIDLEIIQFGNSREIQVVSNLDGQLNIQAFSLSGQLVKTESKTVSEGNISTMEIPSSGLYIVSATIGNNKISRKVFIK